MKFRIIRLNSDQKMQSGQNNHNHSNCGQTMSRYFLRFIHMPISEGWKSTSSQRLSIMRNVCSLKAYFVCSRGCVHDINWNTLLWIFPIYFAAFVGSVSFKWVLGPLHLCRQVQKCKKFKKSCSTRLIPFIWLR